MKTVEGNRDLMKNFILC